MVLIKAARAIYGDAITVEELLMEVPESALFQAYNLHSAANGWVTVSSKLGVADSFKTKWEKAAGKTLS